MFSPITGPPFRVIRAMRVIRARMLSLLVSERVTKRV